MNLFAIAGGQDCNSATAGVQACPGTIDPTVNGLLNIIRASTAIRGNLSPLGTGSLTAGSFFRQTFSFNNPGQQRRRFLVTRFDVNITKKHSLDVIYNDQPFRSKVFSKIAAGS